jgi:S-adenosylmethionine:tRNA ribosyltransferase-isomerase
MKLYSFLGTFKIFRDNKYNKKTKLSMPHHHQYTLADFDFELPPELIAQFPSDIRSHSRLLDARTLTNRYFTDILPQHSAGILKAGDLLVLNDTKVIHARLFLKKETGGAVEILLERTLTEQGKYDVLVMAKSSKGLKSGQILFPVDLTSGQNSEFTVEVLAQIGRFYAIRFHPHTAEKYPLVEDIFETFGQMPLPPYIQTTPDLLSQEDRYQTVYNNPQHLGSVAAPTAGLHFDEKLLEQLISQGVEIAKVMLNVGSGTFLPVQGNSIEEHIMHYEKYEISPETQKQLALAKAQNRRIIAVGTTTVRTLESYAQTGQLKGDTNLFITPGFKFQWVDGLFTNFHLPKSTLMMLVSAFAGYDLIKRVYEHAIAHQYRFFSYGDSMFLEREKHE